MAIKALRKIQVGREVTSGTAVAATALWRGMGTIDDLRETVFPKEDVGIIGGTDRSYVPKLYGELQMDPVEATFEQILHVLEAGIKTIGAGVADGVGSGKVYDYALPTTAQATIKTYTLEGGDDQQAEELEYGVVSEFSLDGKAGEGWMVGAKWFGRQVSLCSFTAAIAIPTVEEMLFGGTKLYIDSVASAFGTTLKSNTLLEASLKVKTGWVPVFTDGALYFSFAKNVGPEVVLEVTFEHDATSVAEKANWRNQTPRAIQLKCEGSSLLSAGTYLKKTMLVNLAGKWEKFDRLGENNGNDVVKGTFRSRYNATAAKFGNVIVVNELASVP